MLLGGQTSKRTADLRENRGVAMLRSLRKCGFCGFVCNQMVADLDPAVTANLSSTICLRLVQKRCIAQAASMLGLADWAQRVLGALDRQQAIVRLSRYPHPIQVSIDDAGELARHAGDQELALQASREVLDRIPFVARTENAEQPALLPFSPVGRPPTAPGCEGHRTGGAAAQEKPQCIACSGMGLTLDRDQHRVMQDVCEEPASGIPERNERLDLAREAESMLRRSLVKMGLLLPAGSVGNKRLLFEPSAKGREWARVHGVSVPKYHASVAHEFLRRRTEQKLALAAPGVRFAHRGTGEPGGVRPDSVAMLPGSFGHRIAVQVAVAHNPGKEADNILKLCGQGAGGAENGAGWVDMVLSVAATKRLQASLERRVKEMNGGEVPPNVVFIDAEAVVDPASSLEWVLEREL